MKKTFFWEKSENNVENNMNIIFKKIWKKLIFFLKTKLKISLKQIWKNLKIILKKSENNLKKKRFFFWVDRKNTFIRDFNLIFLRPPSCPKLHFYIFQLFGFFNSEYWYFRDTFSWRRTTHAHPTFSIYNCKIMFKFEEI